MKDGRMGWGPIAALTVILVLILLYFYVKSVG